MVAGIAGLTFIIVIVTLIVWLSKRGKAARNSFFVSAVVFLLLLPFIDYEELEEERVISEAQEEEARIEREREREEERLAKEAEEQELIEAEEAAALEEEERIQAEQEAEEEESAQRYDEFREWADWLVEEYDGLVTSITSTEDASEVTVYIPNELKLLAEEERQYLADDIRSNLDGGLFVHMDRDYSYIRIRYDDDSMMATSPATGSGMNLE